MKCDLSLSFFGEYVRYILRARYVFDVDMLLLYCFYNCVISELYVTDRSSGAVLAPLNAGHVVVVDWYWVFHECIGKL